MQSTFRILSELDGTLARQASKPAAFTLPRLPYAVLTWLALLACGVLIGADGSFDFTVRLVLVAVAVMHALGCAFLTFAQNDSCELSWTESIELFLPVAAVTWTLPVLSMTVFGDATAWQPGLAAISGVIGLAMFLLYWPLRLSWTTGKCFGSSFCQVLLANLVIASPLAVVFALALGLAAWLA
jgi:energy-converting hydrogenase Eha subunit A